MQVPVVDSNRTPLMPCSPKRARKLVERREATPFWNHGIFCIRLNQEPSARHTQPIATGVDPGKRLLYGLIQMDWNLSTVDGWKTAEERTTLGLPKSSDKLSGRWSAHCVEAWILARLGLGFGRTEPRHRQVLRSIPIRRQRRCLHRANASKGGIRRPYGGTNKAGLKTGTLVICPTYGECITGGGNAPKRVSLHSRETGKRVTQSANVERLKVLTPLARRTFFLPALKDGVSRTR